MVVGLEVIHAQAGDEPRPVVDVDRGLAEAGEVPLVHPVGQQGLQGLALYRVTSVDVDVVVAALHPEGGVGGHAGDLADHVVADLAAEGGAPVVLGVLVAVDRVVQEVGEVVEQGELVADGVGRGGDPAGTHVLAGGLDRQAEALGLAAVGGVERAEAADQALGHRAPRLVGRGVPGAPVIEGGHGDAIGRLAMGVAAARFTLRRLSGWSQGPSRWAPSAARIRRLSPPGSTVPPANRRWSSRVAGADRDLGRQALDEAQVIGAHGGEVALGSIVGPLGEVDARGQFRYQEVEVGVALAVGVGALVDGHAADPGRQVRAVVEVEAAQQVLVGLPSPEWTVTTRPGTVSRSWPTRNTGRSSSSCLVTAPSRRS